RAELQLRVGSVQGWQDVSPRWFLDRLRNRQQRHRAQQLISRRQRRSAINGDHLDTDGHSQRRWPYPGADSGVQSSAYSRRSIDPVANTDAVYDRVQSEDPVCRTVELRY